MCRIVPAGWSRQIAEESTVANKSEDRGSAGAGGNGRTVRIV